MSLVSTVGIDLAKNVFSVQVVDDQGMVVARRTLSRAKLSELVAQLPPCLIGMEACTGAHDWARRFAGFGHTVKLMAPKFVAPYRKGGKNDSNDAEAICEAVTRPNMRFVPVKSVPRQWSSGGKERLGRITKRGDSYLCGLLTQGARSTLLAAQRKMPEQRTELQVWIVATHDRIGYHKTLVAIANKHARMLWAILAHGENYDPGAWRRHAPAMN